MDSARRDRSLTLTVITKNSPNDLRRLLSSVQEAKFDEIIIADTSEKAEDIFATEAVCVEFGAIFLHWKDPNPDFQGWYAKWVADNQFENYSAAISDFGHARKFVMDHVKTKYAMWLDTDDILVGADKMPEVMDKIVGDDRGIDSATMQYVYARDTDNDPTLIHWRHRIVQPKHFKWFPFLHEELIANTDIISAPIPPDLVHVEHLGAKEEKVCLAKDIRNLGILTYHKEKQGKLEARMTKSIGQALRGVKRYADAIKHYEEHIAESDWDEDVYHSWMMISECYRHMNMSVESEAADHKAMALIPFYPNAYASLASTCLHTGRMDRALYWAQRGLECKIVPEEFGWNPTAIKLGLLSAKFLCLYEGKDYENAWKVMQEIDQEFPNKKKEFEEARKNAYYKFKQLELSRHLGELVIQNKREGQEEKNDLLLKAAPRIVLQHPSLSWVNRKQPPEDKESLAIVCPPSAVQFGPDSLKDGIGGSEEAVILLAPELAKQNYYTDVFADGPGSGTVGVNGAAYRWYEHDALRGELKYDHLIHWRSLRGLEEKYENGKQYLWLHDIQMPAAWKKHHIENVDKVFFLSKYHREITSWVPDDKAVITRNGISLDWCKDPQNDPKRVIYASNPTRGLEVLLDIWPRIHEKTRAILHIFYGFPKWHTQMISNSPREIENMRRIQSKIMRTPGLVDHGMVGQMELAEQYAKAGVCAYPATFGEISCISMMKAQAMGAVPITAKFGALDETVQWGEKLGPDRFTMVLTQKDWIEKYEETLLRYLENPKLQEDIRKPMVEWARKRFPWSGVAEQWKQILSQ